MMKVRDRLLNIFIKAVAIFILILIVAIYVHIFIKSRPVLSPDFLFTKPNADLSKDTGGIFPALIGTFYLGAFSGVLAAIFALSLSFYIVFYRKSKILDFYVFLVSGIPSIIYGLFYYSFMVYGFKINRGLFVASVTIATMIIPFIVIRVRKILEFYKETYYLQALALGLSKEHIIYNIIFKLALLEIIMSILLAISYGIGAVAPIIYTGVVINAGVPRSINAPFMSLAYHLYILVNNGFSMNYAYASAFVLISMIMFIHIFAKLSISLSRRKDD